MDITSTLEAKSSQLNTDDLLAGAKTITITKVSAGSAEQPVAVSFEGDGGKPWYPCKSMRRVLVAAWGANALQYVGRRVTLFRDPSVIYGGIAVGGIRVSHLSHLDGPLSIALTVTRQKRSPYTVTPLPAATPAASAPLAASSEDLLVLAAEQSCRRSGLTNAGIAAFVREFSQGSTSDLRDAPPEVLAKIGKQGISAQTVERCNAVPADGADDLPAASRKTSAAPLPRRRSIAPPATPTPTPPEPQAPDPEPMAPTESQPAPRARRVGLKRTQVGADGLASSRRCIMRRHASDPAPPRRAARELPLWSADPRDRAAGRHRRPSASA
jgi:hypothetical protein